MGFAGAGGAGKQDGRGGVGGHMLHFFDQLVEYGVSGFDARLEECLGRDIAFFRIRDAGDPLADIPLVDLHDDVARLFRVGGQTEHLEGQALEVEQHDQHERMLEQVARPQMKKIPLVAQIEAVLFKVGAEHLVGRGDVLVGEHAVEVGDHGDNLGLRADVVHVLDQRGDDVPVQVADEEIQPVHLEVVNAQQLQQRAPAVFPIFAGVHI